MFFKSHSIVSYVSVLSSTSVSPRLPATCGLRYENFPSDPYVPRISWRTMMYPSRTSGMLGPTVPR